MLTEFIEFVNSIFPSISPELRDQAKTAIQQFDKKEEKLKYLMLSPLQQLSQGDIISKVPFSYFEDTGEQKAFITDAIVLSTSCHIDQKDRIIMAPVFPLDSFKGNLLDLKKNLIYDYMYIPDSLMADKYIDFEYINTYSKKLIEIALKTDKIKRIASLNQLGYYLFAVKLTIYLLRREDSDTLTERNVGFAYN